MSENYEAVIGVFCAGVGVVALALYYDGRVPDTTTARSNVRTAASRTQRYPPPEFREHLSSLPAAQVALIHNNPQQPTESPAAQVFRPQPITTQPRTRKITTASKFIDVEEGVGADSDWEFLTKKE